jgi:hypothetical protein
MWLESLKPNSINSWEDLKWAFIDNFQGSMIRAGTHHDLSQVKLEMNETLRSCHGGLTANPSTHRWWERPQPAFHEYSEEDGTRHLLDAHPQQSSFLRHCPG